MYDALKFIKVEERSGKTWHVAEPGKVIPATIARIQEALLSKHLPPEELVDPKAKDFTRVPFEFLTLANSVSAEAWEAALRIKINQGEEFDQAIEDYNQARAFALQQAWSWFKRALAIKVGEGVLLHITKDLTFKE